jgi:corrinoid protein of di/trimethylamine methyltransferase
MEIMGKLAQAVMNGNQDEARKFAEELVASGFDLHDAIERLTDAMRIVGEKFDKFELFLPEMMLAARAMTTAMDVIGPNIALKGGIEKKGKVVMGAPAGDMHEIGKDIVITVLKANGFEVVDLGPNVNSLDFVNKAKAEKADIIGISALMTTTMPGAGEIIELLKEKGLRDKIKVMVGGAPTTPEWAKIIGADGWAENASQAVTLAEKLLK